MTKQEAEYLISQMKSYLDDELSQIQDRGKVTFHAFERKFMEVQNGGAPLDVATFRLFLRECSAGYGTSNIEVVETTPQNPSNQTLYFFKNGEGYILKIYYNGEWIELYDKEELAKVAETGNYNDLINKPAIPSAANDATLTITRNNVEIGTFSANASANKTINISVPDGANDGKLTINVGGIERGSFSANQSTDSVINLDAINIPNNGKLTIKVDNVEKGNFTANQETDTVINIPTSGGAKDRIRRVSDMDGIVAETDPSVGEGEIVQYTGTTNESYVNGYFYKLKTIKVEYEAQFTGLKQLIGITDATLASPGYTNMMLFFDETKIDEVVTFAKEHAVEEADGSYRLAVSMQYDHNSFKTQDDPYSSEYNKICTDATYSITYGENDESMYFTREELENNYGFIIRNKGFINGSQTQFFGDEVTWQIKIAKLDEQDQYTFTAWLQHNVQPTPGVVDLSEYAKITYVNSSIATKEDLSNKVTTISASSTDDQYGSAKATYTALSNKQDMLAAGNNIDITSNIILAKGYTVDSDTNMLIAYKLIVPGNSYPSITSPANTTLEIGAGNASANSWLFDESGNLRPDSTNTKPSLGSSTYPIGILYTSQLYPATLSGGVYFTTAGWRRVITDIPYSTSGKITITRGYSSFQPECYTFEYCCGYANANNASLIESCGFFYNSSSHLCDKVRIGRGASGDNWVIDIHIQTANSESWAIYYEGKGSKYALVDSEPTAPTYSVEVNTFSKHEETPIITVSTSGAVTQAIDCDKLYRFTAATSLTITFNTEPDDGYIHEYMFEFTGSSDFTLTVPSTVKWQSEPDPTTETTYQVSIVNNVGLIAGGLE